MHENAGLKSELASLVSNLEIAEREAKSMGEKYAAEQQASSRANEAAVSMQLQLEQLRNNNIVQIDQFEGRKAVVAETLAIKEKQLNDFENKRVALEARVEFFSRMNFSDCARRRCATWSTSAASKEQTASSWISVTISNQ